MKQIIEVPKIHFNIAPEALHKWARHYYKCKQDFKNPDEGFSPVPYYLLCKAIELELKSKIMFQKKETQSHVSERYGHNLLEAYLDLIDVQKILSENELQILEENNKSLTLS